MRGLAQLEAAGWLPARLDDGRNQAAAVPEELLLDRRVGVQGKLLYAVLQLKVGYQGAAGQFTYAELSGLTGVSLVTVKQAVKGLHKTGWLALSQANKFTAIHFSLHNPVAERREAEAEAANRRLEEAAFLGEALMREYLSLIVESDEYSDNASPGFLINPFTDETMQFDRYYPPHVAFEFNGPQHYGPTARYASEAESWKQRGRDFIKMGICVARGIHLLVLHPEDLTLALIRQKVAGLLPLRNLNGHEPLIAYLESVSRAYRRKARQEC